MNREEVLKYMYKHPWTIRQGAKKTVKLTHSTIDDVLYARLIILNENGVLTKLQKHERKVKFPRILIFDIETSPMKAYVWKRWKENISLDLTISEWFVICWSAKWLYSDVTLGDVLTPEEILQEDDSRVVKSLWKLFDEADIIVAHNGDRFDVPRMNARFIINGLNPPSSYRTIDTCTVAKKQFGFSSNKLDALATYFGFKHKLDTNFDLWKSCLEGNEQSLLYMLKYNKRDATLLEEVYLRLRPWIKNHPNVGNYLDLTIPVCSNCGSYNLSPIRDKYYYTQVGKYPLYRCKCGCITRGRKSIAPKLSTTTLGR